MTTFRNHPATKIVALLLSAVLPICFGLFLAGSLQNEILSVLWCGFYGAVLVCVCAFPWWVKLVTAVVNLLPFGMLALGFLMSGWGGLFWLIGKAVLPFAF